MKKLAIITTHPIQYNAPLFRLLSQRGKINIKVFYTWGKGVLKNKFDPGFGQVIEWDIPLLDGYDHCFVNNTATDPGSHHFNGINNPDLIKELHLWKPDALLIYGWRFKTHLKLLRYFKSKIKILFRGDSNLLDEDKGISIKAFTRKLFLRWVYKNIDLALYVGKANKDYYLKYGLKKDQMLFVPHAVDMDRFCAKGENLRTQLNIPEHAIVFLFTGKLESKKNPLLLMESFAQLNKTETHLLIVGSGALENSLKIRVLKFTESIQSRIHFLPFQNQQKMPAIYRTGDILVLPSRGPNETWGLSVNEAMATGKAVLVSDKCGCATDLVEDDFNGYIFNSDLENDLLQKMKLLTNNKNKLTIMGLNSLDKIQKWSFENASEAIESSLIY